MRIACFSTKKGIQSFLFNKNVRYSASAKRNKRKESESNDDNSNMPHSQPTKSTAGNMHVFEFDPKEFNTFKLGTHLPPELSDPISVIFIHFNFCRLAKMNC